MTHRIGWRTGAKNAGVAMLAAIVGRAAFSGSSGIEVDFRAATAKASPLAPDRLSAEFSLCGESRRGNWGHFITTMNRLVRTDSKLSLDEQRSIGQPVGMLKQPYHIYTERTDPTKNMARFYAMEISQTLFGEPCLTRRWGRIGASGQSMVHHFENEKDAVMLFLQITRHKRTRGYRPRSAVSAH